MNISEASNSPVSFKNSQGLQIDSTNIELNVKHKKIKLRNSLFLKNMKILQAKKQKTDQLSSQALYTLTMRDFKDF